MKVCPVCNESFARDLNFCDVDGTRLTRQRDASGSGEQSKVWQLLGVGLLLGALVISAASIFLPKNRVNPTASVSGSAPVESPANRAPADETANPVPSTAEVSEDSLAGADEIALADMKKRERALVLASQSSGTPGPNPKAAALEAEESEKASATEEKQPVQPQQVNTEAVPSSKAVNETREPPPAPKPAPAVAETKETKKQAAESKVSGKESPNKKKGDEKEKKGGFLRVFKKIFGKG